jgi:D-alanyl-D-alanine carboxypeptidase (penicillin-binding protein 5/6)
MKIKFSALICALVIGASLAPARHAAATPLYKDLPEVDIWSHSAILVHAQTDEILYRHNIYIRREPASLTKVMTVLLALEYAQGYGSLNDVVTAQESDFSDIIQGASNAGIVAGEEMTLRDLIYCAMLRSANEACNMIARHVAGSVEAFMEMVNLRLAEIGAEDTRFVNPHGLPADNHYTTAYDLYLMARECLRNPEFAKISNTETYTLAGTNKRPDGQLIFTTNDLITRRRVGEAYIYPHARGVKTGHTRNAGYCLMSAAEQNGIMLISVILGAEVDEETNLLRSFTETRDLFEWGFEHFDIKTILNTSAKLKAVPVIQGLEQDEIYLVPERAVEHLIPKDINIEDILGESRIMLHEPYDDREGIRAPVKKGDVLGEIRLEYQGIHYGTIPLLSDRDVDRDTIESFQTGLGNFFSSKGFIWGVIILFVLIGGYVLLAVAYNRRHRRNMSAHNYRGRKRS